MRESKTEIAGSGSGSAGGTPNRGSNTPSRRHLLRATAGITLGGSVAGCLGAANVIDSSDEPDDVRIGVIEGTSLVESTLAAEVAAEWLNEDGGIDGREVTIISEDTNSSPLEARRSYHRLLLEEDVDLTVGISNDAVLNRLIEDMAEQETLHFTTGIGSGNTDEKMGEDYERYKYHFRTGPLSGNNFVQNQFQFVRELFPRQGWNSVALLMEGHSWTEGLMSSFQGLLHQAGFDVPYANRYRPSLNDFTSIYDDIEETAAEFVWVAMAGTGHTPLRQWAAQRRQFHFGGIHVPMQSPQYYNSIDGAPRYAITSTSATAESELTDLTQPFLNDYQDVAAERGEVSSQPIYTAYNTFDSILAYERAVEEAGTFDTDAVIEALKEIEVEGTTGIVEYYDENADAEAGNHPHDRVYDPESENHSGSVFFQWQETDDGEGVQQVIWPDDVAPDDALEEPHWFE